MGKRRMGGLVSQKVPDDTLIQPEEFPMGTSGAGWGNLKKEREKNKWQKTFVLVLVGQRFYQKWKSCGVGDWRTKDA